MTSPSTDQPPATSRAPAAPAAPATSRAPAAPASVPGVKDVARLAGVSVGTVSNVINRRPFVRPEARERVEQAISELGFVRNATAQTLRTGVSPLVGVAVLDLTNPFFMEAAVGMERRLTQEGCVMALSSTRSDLADEASLLRTLAGQGVRGVLLTPTDTEFTVAHQIVDRGVPVVLFDSPATPTDMSSVSVDDHGGARLAVQHLLHLGHRRITLLNGPTHVRQSVDRRRGAETAIARHARSSPEDPASLTVITLRQFTADAGRTGVRRLLAGAGVEPHSGTDGVGAPTGPLAPPTLPNDFPTALFCANDLIAFGAMTALRDSGVRIPQDVSLVGFDDIPVASQMSVPLTTVRQPMEQLGWAAADLLFDEPARIRHTRFAPTLVARASSAPPRSGAARPAVADS